MFTDNEIAKIIMDSTINIVSKDSKYRFSALFQDFIILIKQGWNEYHLKYIRILHK